MTYNVFSGTLNPTQSLSDNNFSTAKGKNVRFLKPFLLIGNRPTSNRPVLYRCIFNQNQEEKTMLNVICELDVAAGVVHL